MNDPTNLAQECLIRWKKDAIEYQQFDKTSDILEILEKLCRNGADLDHLEYERGFALVTHVFWSKMLIKFFLRNGMDVNARDQNGDTVLHLAIRHHRFESDLGFNSATNSESSVKVIKYILKKAGADPNVQNLRGETPLFTLAKYRPSLMWRVAKMLIKRGAEVTCNGDDGRSIFHMCIYHINYRFIKVFCGGNGGDIDVRTSPWLYSQTPLMFAARENRLESCRILIDNGAFVNATDLQGYTALHHAALNGALVCAQFLVENGGADINAITSSGRNVYDLGIRAPNSRVFTLGDITPERQVEMLELAKAMELLDRKSRNHVSLPDSLPNYEFLRRHRQNNIDISNYRDNNEEIIVLRSAMNKVASLSKGIRQKLWNLFSFSTRNLPPRYHLDILKELSEEMKDGDVKHFVSIEEIDFKSILNVVEFFRFESKNEATPVRISQLHFIARLAFACFEQLTHATSNNCKKVSSTCTKLYVTLCLVLTSLHVRFDDVISEATLNENKDLLKKLINLDLRDGDSNSLTHLLLSNNFLSKYDYELIGALFDFEFLDVKAKNGTGFEPVQTIHWKRNLPLSEEFLKKVLVKMAARGAHIDARNAISGEQTLRAAVFDSQGERCLLFQYDNLQCACARVLVKSKVPYMVPELIVDFIREHIQF